MSETKSSILPLYLNMSHGKVYVIKTKKVNTELSLSAEVALIENIKIKTLENDEKNRQVIINKGLQGQELILDYTETVYIEETSALLGASAVNKQQKRKLQEDMDVLFETQVKLENLMKYYTEELPKVNLI